MLTIQTHRLHFFFTSYLISFEGATFLLRFLFLLFLISQARTWESRPTISQATQNCGSLAHDQCAIGVAAEYIVALCNELGAIPWLTMPTVTGVQVYKHPAAAAIFFPLFFFSSSFVVLFFFFFFFFFLASDV